MIQGTDPYGQAIYGLFQLSPTTLNGNAAMTSSNTQQNSRPVQTNKRDIPVDNDRPQGAIILR